MKVAGKTLKQRQYVLWIYLLILHRIKEVARLYKLSQDIIVRGRAFQACQIRETNVRDALSVDETLCIATHH